MTRLGGRDTSRVFEIHLFCDEEYRKDYLSLLHHLSPTLQVMKKFPLLELEETDQIIKVNGIDVRQYDPKKFIQILEALPSNKPTPEHEPLEKDQLLSLTYIKRENLKPEKYL